MPGLRLIEARDLKRMCELKGSEDTCRLLEDALAKKELRADDFSIRELAEAFMGREWVDNLHPRRGRTYRKAELTEAAEVSYGDFSNITGQIVFSKFMEGYQDEEFVFSKLIPVVPTDIQDMEKIPGLSGIGDESQVVLEGQEYQRAGFGENYIHVAAKRKRGMIVGLTREAIHGDKTGQILNQAKQVGHYQGTDLEKRCIDAIIDENAGAASATAGGHRYYWRDTSYGTYQASTPWINIRTSNALVDYTDVDNALQTLMDMTDPFTGEPTLITARDILVTPQNYVTALRIINSTQVITHASGYNASTTVNEMGSNNPLAGMGFNVYMSQLLEARAATDTDWWLVNLKRLVNRFVNWDVETEEAGPNHPDAFERDIMFQVRSSIKDVVSVVEPRAAVENQG